MNTETVKEDAVAPSVLNDGLGELEMTKEGFYEKLWKDFCSLQRGDVTLVCRDAERYRYLRDHAHPDSDEGLFVASNEQNDWGNRYTKHYTGNELDIAIDAASKVTPNVKIRG